MKKIQKEDLESLDFNGIIIGVPSYVEIDQHKDILFKISFGVEEDKHVYYSVCYNADYLPNGLTLYNKVEENKEKLFKFDSYDYYKFDNMSEFCQWYLQKQKEPVNLNSFVDDFPTGLKRKDKLKEIRDYVQQVLNIEYYKNFSIFNKDEDNAMKEFARSRAEALKQQLVDWLEEEV